VRTLLSSLALVALTGCGGLVPLPYKTASQALFDPTPAEVDEDSGGDVPDEDRPPADLECADTWLGSAVGPAVAAGTNSGMGDDHAYCGEEGGADTGWSYRAGAGEDLLYWWSAPADGAYTFDTNGSTFDTMLTLYLGGCDGAILGCNDDSVYGLSSQLSGTFRRGDVVIIALDGYSETAFGDFVLNISEGAADTGWWSGDSGFATPAPAMTADPTVRVLVDGDGLRVKIEGAGAYDLALARADAPHSAEACGLLREDGVEARCHRVEAAPKGCDGAPPTAELLLRPDTSGTPGVGASRYGAADLDQLGLLLRRADGACFTVGAPIPAFAAEGCAAL
jgi:hypothetical protein